MKITPITDRLYKIEEVFDNNTVQELLSIDWLNVPWQRGKMQETWPRRLIFADGNAVIKQISNKFYNIYAEIEKHLSIKLVPNQVMWWLDEPGFDVSLHTDGELPGTMQLFWIAPGTQYGTKFYNFKREEDLLADFDFIPNTGYIMLNKPNEDGSQPLNWHGMLNKVPKGTFRLCSYTIFNDYTKV